MTSPSSNSSEAKLKAEARRRRILEQSQVRIGAVSGEAVPAVDPATLSHITEAATSEEHGSTTTSTAPIADTTQTVSGMSRYAQARRKRFTNKKEVGVEVEDPKKEVVVTETQVRTEEQHETVQLSSTEETVLQEDVHPDPTRPTTVKEEEEEEEEEEEVTVTEDEAKEEEMMTQVEPAPIKTDKKYMGVAKMRRKLLAEQKAASLENTNSNPVVSNATTKSETTRRNYLRQIPILVHLFTVCALFLSGFHIGMDNHPSFQSHRKILVHRQVSVMEKGVGIWNFRTRALSFFHKKQSHTEASWVPPSTSDSHSVLLQVEEEFSPHEGEINSKPLGVQSPLKGNIDPLFRVDLDALTAGQSGFFFSAARIAISIHRFFLFLFWTYPLGLITRQPLPIFFILAVLIRFSAKYLLGMNSEPNLTELWDKAYQGGETKGASSSSSSSSGSGIILDGSDRSTKASNFVVPDVITVAKNFVYNMIQTHFPIMTLVYGMVRDARSDMFVVLCGFFLGIAFPLHIWEGLVQSTSDEL